MKQRPHILITNDDGINAPGIRHLWQALAPIADLTIVAPHVEQSGVGLSITIRSPLRIEKAEWAKGTEAWSINGTPADCVKLALNVILEDKPDLIVSGINRGTNAGRNILYSGTVAGIIEGVMHEIPGVAFSCWDLFNPGFSEAAKYVPAIVNHVIEHPLPRGSLLNVNFPSYSGEFIKGFKMTRQGQEYWAENPDKRHHPTEGSAYYWLGSRLAEFEEEEDSDIAWLKQGYLTAVPIHINELTDHAHLRCSKAHFEKLF